MLRNRILELRKARGWSQNTLGEHIKPPVDWGQVNKIEKQYERLDLEWIHRMADAFGVDPIEIVDDRKLETQTTGCDAERFTPDKGDPFATLQGPNRELWRVKTGALDELGLTDGEILLVDTDPASASNPQTGDTLLVKTATASGDVYLLRVFLEPSLLVTNARTQNTKPLNMKVDKVQIIGRVQNHLRTVRPNTRY